MCAHMCICVHMRVHACTGVGVHVFACMHVHALSWLELIWPLLAFLQPCFLPADGLC